MQDIPVIYPFHGTVQVAADVFQADILYVVLQHTVRLGKLIQAVLHIGLEQLFRISRNLVLYFVIVDLSRGFLLQEIHASNLLVVDNGGDVIIGCKSKCVLRQFPKFVVYRFHRP